MATIRTQYVWRVAARRSIGRKVFHVKKWLIDSPSMLYIINFTYNLTSFMYMKQLSAKSDLFLFLISKLYLVLFQMLDNGLRYMQNQIVLNESPCYIHHFDFYFLCIYVCVCIAGVQMCHSSSILYCVLQKLSYSSRNFTYLQNSEEPALWDLQLVEGLQRHMVRNLKGQANYLQR